MKNDDKLILLLKVSIGLGFLLICIGIYFHLYSGAIKAMGVTGIIISAVFVAVGMVLSLPTKMYLTFLLMKNETNSNHHKK
ncbi:hypothetical protein [Paraferrimonas sp. SM1919]|uniref:hypothetical protein n=1 Tax=Paraferrimonas sp. SM1919 TaxID=2662263 RepID=UPI0013CFE840|nr:hypothetical protein [Paraferrimonas sp. SM1919]